MIRPYRAPLAGLAAAIAITTGLDANGLTAVSALPLFPLALLFWRLERLPTSTMGLRLGRGKDYLIAVMYPIVVLGAIGLIAVGAGQVEPQLAWPVVGRRVATVATMTALVVLLTEEGFFRGWLWGSLERRDLGLGRVLAVSSIGFALWHWSWVTLDPDSRLPPLQIPVFLANAALLGAIWGLLRWRSGSILVASVSHGLWNGLDYVLFGAGPKVGALGIVDTAVYGPEVGLLGLVANLAFAALLWRRSIGDGLAPNARAPVARAAP